MRRGTPSLTCTAPRAVAGGMNFKIEWKSGTREQWHAEDGEGFERVLSYHMRAYSLRRSKQVRALAVVSLVVSCVVVTCGVVVWSRSAGCGGCGAWPVRPTTARTSSTRKRSVLTSLCATFAFH